MKSENYLKKELYALIKTDDSIFEFIQAGSLDGIWYWDLKNNENEWLSPKFWEILGYDPKEMKHLTSEWQEIIFQEDLQLAFTEIQSYLNDPSGVYQQTLRYRHKNGSTVWVRCRGVAILDENGTPIRMLGAHNDVTELMQIQEQLIDKQKKIEELNKRLYEQANKDELTEILNRRGLHEKFEYFIERAKRDMTPLSLAYLDIDFFKKINDTYGHTKGDLILKEIGQILMDTSRESDIVGRYGGEEFIVIMPNTDKIEAIIATQRIRTYVQEHKLGVSKKITISCGIQTMQPLKDDDASKIAEIFYKQADKALYTAKENGRNKVIHFEDLMD